MTRLIPYILLIFFVTSCATTKIQNSGDSGARFIASKEASESCINIAAKIINQNSDLAGAHTLAKNLEFNESNKNIIEPSFTKMLLKRTKLKEKYEKVIESIKDFNPAADIAIKGKAKLLIDPQEAYLSKIMMIRRAKYSLDISYYIFNDDESGRALLHEVRLAIKRGVKVRIMLDSLGTAANAPFYSDVKALSALRGGRVRDLAGNFTDERAKAEVVIINPLFNIRKHVSNWFLKIQNLFVGEEKKIPLTTFSMNRRSHDKILMIDAHSAEDSMAIIGGRNIANYYYGLDADGKTTFQDVEILLKNIGHDKGDGDVHNALENYYNKLFYYTANKNLQNFLFKINRSGAKKQFAKMRDGYGKLFDEDGLGLGQKLKKMEEAKYLDQNLEEGMVSILNELQNFSRTKAFLKPLGAHNPTNGDSLFGRLHESMRNAKSSIEIVSPYLWLSDEDITFFIKWLAEDPNRVLKVISNSVSTTDNIPAQAMVDTILGPKLVKALEGTDLARQLKIYSYGRLDDVSLGGNVSYGKLHAKFAIIDDNIVMVGTSNLDPRSRYLNSELGVLFEEKAGGATANELKGYFNGLVDKSYEWGSDDWKKVRAHESNRISIALQVFAGKIINYFNILPLI